MTRRGSEAGAGAAAWRWVTSIFHGRRTPKPRDPRTEYLTPLSKSGLCRFLALLGTLLFLAEPAALGIAQAAGSDPYAPVTSATDVSTPTDTVAPTSTAPTTGDTTQTVTTETSTAVGATSPTAMAAVVGELTDRRTALSREYQLADGSRKVEVYLDPVNYTDASGAWQPIDETLSVSERAGFALENTTNSFATYLGGGENRGTVTIEDGTLGLTISPHDALAPADSSAAAPTVLDGTATYADLFPLTSARYSILPGEVKEELILAGDKASPTFAFRLQTQGLTPQANGDGSITFTDGAGTARFQIPRPFALDSAPEKPARVDLTQTLRTDGSDYVLEVKLDPGWLSDPSRVFPVVVDPTVMTQNVSADTYVNSLYPTQSYGTSYYLHVASEPEYAPYHGTEQSLVKFVLPTLTEYPQIQSASLLLYASSSVAPASRQISASRITSSWTTSVTWNSRPSYSGTPDSTTSADGGVGSYSFDITPSVTAWYAGTAPNYGTLLSLTAGSSSNCRTFYASEASANAAPPKLSIVYKAGDPRHTTYDLGEFAGHQGSVTLDKSRLELLTTDLAIASFGPPAALSRHYSSARTAAGVYAYGWRFNYEQKLTFPSGTQTDYTDAAGEVHSFFYETGAWRAPQGLIATLTPPPVNPPGPYVWTLTFKDRSALTFDTSGRLTKEIDRNGNATTYTYPTNQVKIQAANGQQITVNLNASGKATSALYTTADGTRQVNYATAAPWEVTYFPGTALEHKVTYTYDANYRLTEVKALAFSSLAGDAKENFIYTSGALTEVRFPDYASSVPLYNSSNTDARALIVYNGQSATVTRYGAVRTAGTPTGVTATAITEDFTWNTTGTLATKTNPKTAGGTTETWSYAYQPSTNLLLSETSPLGKLKQWTYDTRGNLLTEKDELLHQTTYTYPTSDADPNRDFPLTVTDPVGAVTTYTYDTNSNVTEVNRDLTGSPTFEHARTTYTYLNQTVGTTTFYKAVTQERSLISGSTWTQTDYNTDAYYANGAPKKTAQRSVALFYGASPVDLMTTTTYDAFGNLLTQTDSSGQVTETDTYDLAGRILTSTGALFEAHEGDMIVWDNHVVRTHGYDAWGHETTSYNTAGADTADKVTTTYDASGRPSQETNYLYTEIQNVTTYRYDGFGHEITRADTTMSGQPPLTAYDARGNVVAAWEAGVSSYTDAKATLHLLADGSPAYDAVGRLLRTTQPGDTSPSILTYTDDGLVSRQTLPDGTYTDHTYDAAHNQTGETRSDGGATSAVFDLGGRTTSATDENNLTTAYTYDCLGRQLTAGAGGAPASTTTYNSLGWTLTRTDADGIATTSVYDTAGRTVQDTTAAQTTTSTYDPAGHLIRQVDPNDKWITFWYDLFGRANREWHTLPGSPPVTVKDTSLYYDALSRVVSTTDNVIQITHAVSYPQNTPAPTTDTLGVGGFLDAVSTARAVAADGLESTRLSTVISNPQLPNVLRTVAARDAGTRVTGATLAAGQPTNNLANYLYDGAGRPQRQWGTSGGGSGFASDAQTTNAYTYDSASGRKSADNLRLSAVGSAGPLVASYTYTDDGRLDTATVDGVVEDDTFDAAGNLTAFTKGGVQTTLSYDTANRLATTVIGATTTYYSFDTTHGRRTSQGLSPNENDPGRIRFTYTGTGRLATYANPGTGVTATYAYDASGQRTQSVVAQNGETTTTAFTYEGLSLLRLTATQTGGENPTSWQLTYLYDEYGKPYAGVYRSPISATTATVFGMVTSDRGDILALTDAAGAPFAAYRHDAWGNPQGTGNLATGVWSQTTSLINATLAAAIAARQPLRYAGYFYDQESGLYHLSARSYDPQTRQFVSKDAAKADGEESAYQYCAGDPVGRVDANGEIYRKINPDDGTFQCRRVIKGYNNWCWVACGQSVALTKGAHVTQANFYKMAKHVNYPEDKAGWPWEVTSALNDLGIAVDWMPGYANAKDERLVPMTIGKMAKHIEKGWPIIVSFSSGGIGHMMVVWAVDPDRKLVKLWEPYSDGPRKPEIEWSWSKLKESPRGRWIAVVYPKYDGV